MSQNHNYLEAAQAGDLSAVKYYLGLQPEVDVNYQDVKLQSALHRSVKANRNSHQMVRDLIEAGIDCSLLDDRNQTAAEFARRVGRGDLMLLMLECEFRDVPVRDVFYQLIRRENMELVCVYVEQQKLSIKEAVRFTEEAYEVLRMKGVRLTEQVQYEVEQELVNYYSKNATFCEIKVNEKELLEYIDFVLENSDEENLNETGDEVLMALRELVKLMYLGKHQYDDAMMEVQYCLCAFVSVYDRLEDTALYTLVINKQMVLRFLRLVAKQLRCSDRTLSSRDRKVRKELRKTFVLLKEVNSVGKIVTYLKKGCEIDLKQHDDKEVNQLVIDRCIQVVGESIKSTKLSPNLSKRMQTAFEYIVSSGTALSYRSTREFHSHGYPVIKYLLEKENDFASYRKLQDNLKSMLSLFECMLSTLLITISKRFLGSLYKMKTIKQMRSLAMFAHLEFIESFQSPVAFTEMFYSEKVVMMLVNDLKILLIDDLVNHQALIYLEDRLKLYFQNMSKQGHNYQQLGQSFATYLRVVRNNHNVDSIRSVLKFPLLHPCPKYSISFCSQESREISGTVRSLLNNLLQSCADKKDHQKIINTALELFNQLDSESSSGLDMVRLKQANRALDRYLKETLHECGADEKVFTQISQKQLKDLSRNIFNVKERFKILALPDSPKLRAVRKKQENELQNAFERKIATLKKLLLKGSQPTGSGPYNYKIKENWTVQFAIEHVLLEISEILLGVGIMKPNLHLLNHRAPVICGKNLRDGLAHDMLMYSVISESCRHLICNAIYYASLSIKLYEKTDRTKPEVLSRNKCSKIVDKLHWFEMQSKLYEQLKDMEKFEFKRVEIDGPDILGCTRETKSDLTMHCNNALIHAIKHNVQIFVDHIDGTKPSQSAQRLINTINHPLIPRKKPNQLSAPEKAQILLSITLAADNFSLYRKVTQKCNASLTYEAAFKQNPAVLNHLDELNLPLSKQMLLDGIETGNTAVFKMLLKKLDTQTIIACSPLLHALIYGQVEMAQLLVEIVKPNEKDAEIAVIYNFNNILKHILRKVKDVRSLVLYAVARDNLEAIKLMEISPKIYSNITGLLHHAAYLNRISILEHFLRNDEWRNRIDELDENKLTAIEICAQNGNYSAVKLLSQYTTNVKSAINRASFSNYNSIVKYLLRHNPHLLPDLRIILVNRAIENKNNSLLKYLLGRHVSDNLDLSQQFLGAINFNNFEALELLLKHDPQCAHAIDLNEKYNAFHIAVQSLSLMKKVDVKSRFYKILNLLVAHKVNPAAKNKHGITPLHQASSFGNPKIVSRLRKLAPNTINEADAIGRTPLITALITENLPIVEYLFKNKAETNVLSTFRYSLLHNAPPVTHFLTTNTECLEYAVKTLHVDPDLTDSFGRTLLHELCLMDSAAMVKFLLEQCKANIAARDLYGETVLHHAVRYDSQTVLEYLLKRPDCELDQPNAQEYTPLVLAIVIPDRMHMAQKLVIAGASKEKLLQVVTGSCREALAHIQ
ncbi:uncharacterized protein LOC135704526 [Ochlerotatus camptorhynchus]|uniref:uncharacterized protein LOC135704526 n=1 Tax=Ochlerotatus camptorhynchus TaxID=644619 RepID=UPI0031D7D8B5